MNRRSKTSSRRLGLTLIEVVAAMALMGTLLVAAVTARARHVHQLADARRRLAAIDAADELIAGWYGSGVAIPQGADGEMPDRHDLRWRTEAIEESNGAAEKLGVRIVRLTVSRVDDDRASPLVTVDLAVAAPPESSEPDASPAAEDEAR